MALPQVYTPITALEFYPDKVTINIQYSVALAHVELDKGFRSNGFRLSNREWTYDLNLHGRFGYGRRGFRVRIGRPRYAAPLNCFVDINPLRSINERTADPAPEYSSIPGGSNWLPSHVVERDNRFVWHLCQHYADTARTIIGDIISDIQAQATTKTRRGLLPPECIHVSVHSLEATIDFQAHNPRQAVVDFMPAFAALLKDNEQREYRAIQVIRPEADLMIHGFVNSSTRIKMYCRTNRRVRFEVQFRPDTFDQFNISRAISGDGQCFEALFNNCAEQSLRLFQALRARTHRSLNIDATHTPLDLVMALAAVSRRPEVLRELLDCLLRTGSVQNSLYDAKLVAKLKARDVLVRSLVHGFSCFSPRYAYSAALLANAQEDFFTPVLRRLVGTFDQAKQRGRRNRRISIYRCR